MEQTFFQRPFSIKKKMRSRHPVNVLNYHILVSMSCLDILNASWFTLYIVYNNIRFHLREFSSVSHIQCSVLWKTVELNNDTNFHPSQSILHDMHSKAGLRANANGKNKIQQAARCIICIANESAIIGDSLLRYCSWTLMKCRNKLHIWIWRLSWQLAYKRTG